MDKTGQNRRRSSSTGGRTGGKVCRLRLPLVFIVVAITVIVVIDSFFTFMILRFFYSYTHSVLFVFFFYFQSPFVPLRSVMQNGNLFHCFVVRQSKPGFMQCMRCYAERKNILLDLTTNETIGVKGFVKAFRSEFQLSLIQTLTNSSFHL